MTRRELLKTSASALPVAGLLRGQTSALQGAATAANRATILLVQQVHRHQVLPNTVSNFLAAHAYAMQVMTAEGYPAAMDKFAAEHKVNLTVPPTAAMLTQAEKTAASVGLAPADVHLRALTVAEYDALAARGNAALHAQLLQTVNSLKNAVAWWLPAAAHRSKDRRGYDIIKAQCTDDNCYTPPPPPPPNCQQVAVAVNTISFISNSLWVLGAAWAGIALAFGCVPCEIAVVMYGAFAGGAGLTGNVIQQQAYASGCVS